MLAGDTYWWQLCVIVSFLVYFNTYEILYGPGYDTQIREVYNVSLPCANATKPSKRVVLLIVDGLKEVSGLVLRDESWTFAGYKCQGELRPNLVAMTSGRSETWFKGSSPSYYDTIFNYVDSTYFFGPASTPEFFNRSHKWLGAQYPGRYLKEHPRHNQRDWTHRLDEIGINLMRKMVQNRTVPSGNRTLVMVQLIGLERASRAFGVKSQKFQDSKKWISYEINAVTEHFFQTFPDRLTTFILVSGHCGSTHNIAPVAMWGNGISKSSPRVILSAEDLCPFISGLFQTKVPVESRGMLPRDFYSEDFQPQAVVNHAYQLSDLCISRLDREAFLSRYLVYTELDEKLYHEYRTNLSFMDVERPCPKGLGWDLQDQAIKCITHLDDYYRGFFIFILIITFAAWIILLITLNMATMDPSTSELLLTAKSIASHILFGVGFIMTCLIIWSEAFPWYMLPCVILPSALYWLTTLRAQTLTLPNSTLDGLGYFVISLFVVEVGYWTSEFAAGGLFFIIPYTTISVLLNWKFLPTHVTALSILSGILLIVFPLTISVIQPSSLFRSALLWDIGSFLWIMAGSFSACRMHIKGVDRILSVAMWVAGFGAIWIGNCYFIGATTIVLNSLAWIILFTPFLLVFGSDELSSRLLQIVISNSVVFSLLSSSEELVVFFILAVHLYSWLRREAGCPQQMWQRYARSFALYLYLVYIFNVLHVFIPTSVMIPIFFPRMSHVISSTLMLAKGVVVTFTTMSFWCAASLFIGENPYDDFKVLLCLLAGSMARASVPLLIEQMKIGFLTFFIVSISFVLVILNVRGVAKPHF